MQLIFKNGLVSREFAFEKEEKKKPENEEKKEDDYEEYDDDTITAVVREGPINFIRLNFANHKVFERVQLLSKKPDDPNFKADEDILCSFGDVYYQQVEHVFKVPDGHKIVGFYGIIDDNDHLTYKEIRKIGFLTALIQ